MKLTIVCEVPIDTTSLLCVTPELIADALQSTETRPLLSDVAVQPGVPIADGFIKFWIRTTVNNKIDETAVLKMPMSELCDLFQNKLRRVAGLGKFFVNSVDVISPKTNRA